MSEFQQRAEALAQKALQRSAAKNAADANSKAAAWAKIKQEAPLLADLMTELSQAFGKPKAARVELKNELVLNVGEFAEPKRFFDGKLRQLPEAKKWQR